MLICSVLIVIFAAYSSAIYLADAAQGLLPLSTVGQLILLKTLITLDMLLSTSLYLAVIVGLGRLYSDTEMAALNASGISELRILRPVLQLSALTAITVGLLAIQVRPWAYQTVYQLQAQALAKLDISRLEPGRFYELGQTDEVLFAESIDRNQNRLDGVLLRGIAGDDRVRVIHARESYLPPTQPSQEPTMVFKDGYGYALDRQGHRDLSLKFKTLILHLSGTYSTDIGYKRKAEQTMQLSLSAQPGDIAEFQWRLSAPIVAVILGLLAVPLSRTPPRQGRFTKLFTAILLFAAYYNLLSLAKSWIDQGRVGAIPGLWWVHLLPLALLVGLIIQPMLAFRTTPWGKRKDRCGS